MTERLYHIKPVIAECRARVVSCEERDGRFFAVLDRTIIFPEGGGQPADNGTLGEAHILDAHEKAGEVVHTLDRAVEPGREYTLTLDLPRRMDHSRQHTGEHILSGLAHKLFGAHNVGFHMAEDYCTIDLDRAFDEEELARLEACANEAVMQNLPVTEIHTDEAGLAELTIRKKSDAAVGDIRVVYIGGGDVDSCTCCGTHCASTGEVGYIRIADSQKYKGGVRLWFSCGERAVREANALTRSMTALARGYSTSREELPAVLRKQSDELASLKRELKARTQALCDMLAQREAKPLSIVRAEGFSANDVKMLTESLVAFGARAALAIGVKDGSTYYRALRADGEKAPMNELIKAVNGLLCGKGGGSPAFAQGSAPKPVTDEELASLRSFAEKWYNGNS